MRQSPTLILWTGLLIALLLGSCNGQTGQTKAKALPPKAQIDSCTLLFVGDVMSHSPQIRAAYRDSLPHYDYSPSFDSIQSLISSADLSVANLETTLGGKPYRGYPMFSAPDELATALKVSGFDLVTTANNHSADRGKRGVIRTLDILDSLGLKHIGTYRSREEREKACPLVLNIKGIKLGFVAYTYGTNGMPIPKPTRIDLIDTLLMRQDLDLLRQKQVDYTIALMHWGIEYQAQASEEQRELARWLSRQGVDAVVGSHPHVPQGSELLRDSLDRETFVLYSLGNFLSNQNTPSATRGGLILSLQLKKNQTTKAIRLSAINYHYSFVGKQDSSGKQVFRILPISLDPSKPKSLHTKEYKDLDGFRGYINKLKLFKR